MPAKNTHPILKKKIIGKKQPIVINKQVEQVSTEKSRKIAREIAWSQCYMYIAYFGFTLRQLVQLQGVNTLFYKRVA